MARYNRQQLGDIRALPWLQFVRYERAFDKLAADDKDWLKNQPQNQQRR